MSFLSFSFSPTSGVALQALSTTRIILATFALGILASTFQYPLHALLSNAITWSCILLACWKLPASAPPPPLERRKRTGPLLAACILAAAICDRVGGDSGWQEALVPITFLCLRKCGLGGLGEVKGRWRTAAVITVAAAVAMGSAVKEGRDVVLAVCAAVFMALAYVLMEDAGGAGGAGGAGDAGGAGGAGELVRLGREVAPYVAAGFAVAAWMLEGTRGGVVIGWHGRGLGWDEVVLRNNGGYKPVACRVVGVGMLEAARWMLATLLMIRCSVVGVAFLDLSVALMMALLTAFSAMKALAAGLAAGGMGWWAVTGSGRRVQIAYSVGLLVLCAALSGLYATNALTEIALHRLDARPDPIISTSEHPIPKLIKEAEDRYYAMRDNQSKTLEEAVEEYRRRYKMNPPPNFDQWYYFAKKKNVVIIDDYDMIYHSIKPFWGMAPKEIRKRARESMGFKDEFQMENNKLLHAYIRGGEVETAGQGPEWQKQATKDMMQGFVEWLPDMDLPFNIHDEPRVVVPYDWLHQHLEKADVEINGLDLDSAANAFSPLDTEEKAIPPDHPSSQFNVFAHQGIWTHSTLSCPPDSPVRRIDSNSKNSTDNSKDKHSGQLLGFIVNATESSDICISPSLENRHGFFDRPNAFNVVKRLYPVFSQSKVSSYGDIVYPSPWYWAHKVPYNDQLDPPWEHKIETLYWRGSTTGGFSRNGGWKRHHRQRVVSVIDAYDTAKILQKNHTSSINNDWVITEVPRESLKELFDVYFSHIGQCDPLDCEEQKRFFRLAPVADQQAAWRWKYLLDVDGNAFSGRYHAFLKSRSVVFKLAVFREWHDEWLRPWVHYIPLSMELEEVAEIMRFFRYEGEGEKYAKRIAEESRSWAQKALRNEDLEAWFFRLLLEYARVVDDNRDAIGFLR